MSHRSLDLMRCRPEISTALTTPDMSDDLRFQNETLRPIIAFQNPLFLVVFQNYIAKHKNRFFELTPEARLLFIENAIQRDIKFRNSLKGIIIGHFSITEYAQYIKNSSALNKRMMNMVIERLKDQVQAFEEGLLV